MIELQKLEEKEAAELYTALCACFVYEERREYDDFVRTLAHPAYTMHHIVKDGVRVGFVGVWQLKTGYFVEHFAIYEPFRNRGLGGETITALEQKYGKIVLEVEAPVEENQVRRIRFYESHGFHLNAFPYFQPSYHGEEAVPLQVMSYPDPLPDDGVIDELYPLVYRTEREAVFGGAFTVAPLAPGDDFDAVARLIYGTDKYIYPYLFGEYGEFARKVLRGMIERDTIYRAGNITVAKLGGKIVGMVVSKAHPVEIDKAQMLAAYTENGYTPDERFERVYNEYFKLLADEPAGVYIANVCVDETLRGQKIGRRMLERFLRPDTEYHLETVKANPAAVRLYESMGFRIDCEYPGFTAVPCYRMTHPVKK